MGIVMGLWHVIFFFKNYWSGRYDTLWEDPANSHSGKSRYRTATWITRPSKAKIYINSELLSLIFYFAPFHLEVTTQKYGRKNCWEDHYNLSVESVLCVYRYHWFIWTDHAVPGWDDSCSTGDGETRIPSTTTNRWRHHIKVCLRFFHQIYSWISKNTWVPVCLDVFIILTIMLFLFQQTTHCSEDCPSLFQTNCPCARCLQKCSGGKKDCPK